MRRIFTDEEERYIKRIAKGRYIGDITRMVNGKFGKDFTRQQVRNFLSRNHIRTGMLHIRAPYYSSKFPEEICKYIEKHHQGVGPTEMAGILNRKFGTAYTAQQLNSYYCNHHIDSGLDGRFKKGHVPANKGKHIKTVGRMAETQYKKGNIPQTHRPVGSIGERNNYRRGQSYLYKKIAEPNVWRPLHILNWEEANGAVPKGYAVIFADGDSHNPDISNLILISRATLATMNRHCGGWKSREECEAMIALASQRMALANAKKKLKEKQGRRRGRKPKKADR